MRRAPPTSERDEIGQPQCRQTRSLFDATSQSRPRRL